MFKSLLKRYPGFLTLVAILAIACMLQAVFSVPGPVRKAGAQSDNLIQNASVETVSPGDPTTPAGWLRGGYGNNNRQLVYLGEGRTGNRALAVTITSHSDGDGKWYFSDVSAEPGLTYQYEAYYLTDGDTALTVRYTDQNGVETYADFLSLPPSPTVWAKATHRFTPPAGTKSLTVFHSLQSRGTLITDDYSLRALSSGAAGEGMVAFAFDDGWSSHMDAGAILYQAGAQGTFFVVSQFMGQAGRLTFPNLQGLAEWGHEIGDHSASHPDLTLITDPYQLTREMILSKLVIGRDIGIENVRGFAYPNNGYNATTAPYAKAAYLYARTSEPGFVDATSNRFELPAMAVNRIQYPDVVGTAKGWMDTAFVSGKLVIIFIHPVDFKKSELSATPDELRAMVAYAKAKGLKIVTVEKGVRRIFGLDKL